MGIIEKFQAVLSIIEEHNSAIGGKDKPGYVDPSGFEDSIKIIGGTSESRLKRLSYEDILQCLPGSGQLKPVALAKEIAAVFRGNDDTKRPISTHRVSFMNPEELIKAFDPEEYTNAVGKRLKDMSRGEAFIVFESGRIVDVDISMKLLKEVKQGYRGRDKVSVNGDIKPVYRVGQLPDAYADENPLYRNRPLRPDGTCDQTGRSWDGISLEIRQLVYLAVQVGDLKVSIETAHNTIDAALRDDAVRFFRERYQKAAMRFNKLQRLNDLPKLTVPMNAEHSTSINKGTKVL